MYRDSELPNGFQDADFEAAELTRTANKASRLAKLGICCHGWTQEQRPGKLVKCLECGKVATWDELNDERRERLYG